MEEVKACVQVADLCRKNGLFQGPGEMPVVYSLTVQTGRPEFKCPDPV